MTWICFFMGIGIGIFVGACLSFRTGCKYGCEIMLEKTEAQQKKIEQLIIEAKKLTKDK